jgi:hypothetical protein
MFEGAPLTLQPTWQENWATIVPQAQELLDNNTIIGFFLGDELVQEMEHAWAN